MKTFITCSAQREEEALLHQPVGHALRNSLVQKRVIECVRPWWRVGGGVGQNASENTNHMDWRRVGCGEKKSSNKTVYNNCFVSMVMVSLRACRVGEKRRGRIMLGGGGARGVSNSNQQGTEARHQQPPMHPTVIVGAGSRTFTLSTTSGGSNSSRARLPLMDVFKCCVYNG